jgi:hypothetical protein
MDNLKTEHKISSRLSKQQRSTMQWTWTIPHHFLADKT